MVVAITGAAGFVGRHLVWHLLESGHAVRGLAHSQEGARALEGVGAAAVVGDVRDFDSVRDFVAGADAVVHLVAILREENGQTYQDVNVHGTQNVVEACRKADVSRLIHQSALGAKPGPEYPYAHGKWEGEELVRASGLDATILRPSLLVGRGHPVFQTLARMVRSYPVVPVPGEGTVKLQPLHVADLARCGELVLADARHVGKTYDLGGPEQLSYDEILDAVMRRLDKQRPKIHIPQSIMVRLADAMAWAQSEPDVTRGEIEQLLREDNVCPVTNVEKHFGFQPRTLAASLEGMF